MKYIEGDLFEGVVDETPNTIIAHVCNDKKQWGKGFVIPLAKAYPASREAYMALKSVELGYVQFVDVAENVKIANMVAQTLGGSRPLFYNHLARCMDRVAEECEGCWRIACPMFGSKLAKGDWNFVEKLIEDCWERKGIEVAVYYLKQFIPDNWTPPSTNVP